MTESIDADAVTATYSLLYDNEHDAKTKLLSSSMRDSRTHCQLEHTLKPTVSSDSMVFLSKPTRTVPTQVPKQILQTAFYLHQQQQPGATTCRKSCLRGPTCITMDQNIQSAEAHVQKEQTPPNVIVFINSVNRQKRRSSKCSQLTMDEEINISHHYSDDGDDDDDDDELSCASLDIQDVFTETRNEFSKMRGKGNNSESIVSSSSYVTSSNSTENYNSPQRYPKRPIGNAETKRTADRKVQIHSKLHKSAQSVFSKRSNTSAKLRWLYEKENGISDDDDDDEDDSNESDYEDFAQDSLLIRNTQTHHRYLQKEMPLDKTVIECNEKLNDNKKEGTAAATNKTNGEGDQKGNVCTSKDLPSPYLNKICMSRAA
jgi:hypothetical protein